MKKLSAFILSVSLLACSNTANDPELNVSPTVEEKGIQSVDNKNDTPVNISSSNVNKEDKTENLPKKESSVSNKVEKNISPKDDIEARLVTDENLPAPPAPELQKTDFSGEYAKILSSYVSSSGKVNYASIKKNTEMLDQAISHYQDNTPKSAWSSNQKLAYWINAYNLFTIKLIVDNYPVSSIKNIAGGKPWDKKFIVLDGKTMSLNEIENGIIRKQFNEPRIHFAVNCASISCPKLLNQEYTSSNLNSLLEKQAKRYINDKNENTFTSNSAKISNIFDWYKGDFDGGVIPFLNKYLASPLPLDAKITYEEYNWNLNN